MVTVDSSSSKFSIYLYCALLALPWIGVQTIWNTEFAVLSPTLKEFGLSDAISTLAWIAGPITGFFTAPFVGSYSDRSTFKFGRRRPFIILGLALTILFSLLFAFANNFGTAARLPVAFISFVCLDVTINIIQTPLRALGSDLAPQGYQETVQLFASVFQGLGGIIAGYLYKVLTFDSNAFGAGENSTISLTLPRVMLTVMGINLILLSVVLVLVKENQPTGPVNVEAWYTPLTASVKGVAKMPKSLAKLCAVQFFCWMGLFSWWTVSSTWWGANLNGTSSSFGDASVYQNVLVVSYSLLLSLGLLYGFLKRVRFIYAFSLAVGSAALLQTRFGTGITGGYIAALFIGVGMSAINSFPFALVGNYNKGNDLNTTGLQMGILNLFICIPQMVVSTVNTILKGTFGSDGNVWVMFLSGVFFGLGAIIALFLDEAPSEKQSDIELNGDSKKF